MLQNTLTIVTRIRPQELDAVDRLLTEIGKDLHNNRYVSFSNIASLHMAGMIIAANDERFAPTLIFESNFDGTEDEYLRELIAHGRPGLDAIYGRCEGYPAEAARDDASILAYLCAHRIATPAFFVGLPGQTVASIRNAIAVRQEVNRFLDLEAAKSPLRDLTAVQIHDRIMAHLRNDSPVKPVIPPITFSNYRWIALRNMILLALLAFPFIVVLAPLLLIWILSIRWLEIREQRAPPKAFPAVDERTYGVEDLLVQNHLATIGIVKDNPIRRFTVKTAVTAVGVLFERVLLRGGFGGVFTLHFAHVIWLDGGRRIVLLTCYDGSALEYIGNFTDTAGYYLNGAYSNVESYPPCRWLIGGGAASLNGFSNWARQHMQYTPVFYTAYPTETVLNLMKDLEIRDRILEARSTSEIERLLKML